MNRLGYLLCCIALYFMLSAVSDLFNLEYYTKQHISLGLYLCVYACESLRMTWQVGLLLEVVKVWYLVTIFYVDTWTRLALCLFE